jgi:probable F420-dependent oxidoreductase
VYNLSMDFGIAIFPRGDGMGVPELARLAEERGFDSLFLPEHTHIPASRETPHPSGQPLPEPYKHTLDPFVALAAAAAATETIKLGTGVCLVNQRDPIVTAKEVATLDLVSGGRVLFGVGAGWNAEEMRNHGVDISQRFGQMRERVEAMKAIWTEEEASYSGRHVNFERIWSWPKPVQRPHPPILVGGNGPKVLDRVIAYGDEWMPNRIGKDEQMIERFDALQLLAEEAGRGEIPITQAGMTRDPVRIERFEHAGVHRILFWLPPTGPDEVEQAMDRYAEAAEVYRRAGA